MYKVIVNHFNIVVLVVFIAYSIGLLFTCDNLVITRDEYIFARITENLPNYNTDAEWLFDSEVTKPDWFNENNYIVDEQAYTTPVWIHPLGANYISYPVVKLVDDSVKEVKWLHLFSLGCIVLTIWLLSCVIKKKFNGLIAGLSILPIFISQRLLISGMYFYNDVFMWLLFASVIWLCEFKPNSKWIVVLSIVMVLCKSNAVLLLVPIIVMLWYKLGRIKYWLIISCGIVVVEFFMFQIVVSGDWLYYFNHWNGVLRQFALNNLKEFVLPNLFNEVVSSGLIIHVVLLVVGCWLIIKNKLKELYFIIPVGLFIVVFGFCWGWILYQIYPIVYCSMFMLAVIINKVKISESNKLQVEV